MAGSVVWRSLCLCPLCLLVLSCARVTSSSAERWGCYPKMDYTPAQVSAILDLRDRGESLKAVAGRVGGSRQDVRAVERQQRPRPRRSGVRDPGPAICPVAGPAASSARVAGHLRR